MTSRGKDYKMAKNKVMFGVSNLHFGLYTEADDGTVTLGTPMKIPGTVNLTMEPESEEVVFYADNVKYWTTYSDNGFTGELENALFPDEFKLAFMNYVEVANGGIGQVKGRQNKKVYFMFQAEGDAEARRTIVYNVSIGQINREHATVEDSIEPGTDTLPISVAGDNKTGLTRVAYPPTSAIYDTMFTTPPVPALPESA